MAARWKWEDGERELMDGDVSRRELEVRGYRKRLLCLSLGCEGLEQI